MPILAPMLAGVPSSRLVQGEMVQADGVGDRDGRRDLPVPHQAARHDLTPDLPGKVARSSGLAVAVPEAEPHGVTGPELYGFAGLRDIEGVLDVAGHNAALVAEAGLVAVEAQRQQAEPGVGRNASTDSVGAIVVGAGIDRGRLFRGAEVHH